MPDYFQRNREICGQYGILLVLDEVMCGMGRTGSLFACESDVVRPDIVADSQGGGCGLPAVRGDAVSGLHPRCDRIRVGFFHHGHTYLGHPIACAAAGAVLTRIVGDGLGVSVAGKG